MKKRNAFIRRVVVSMMTAVLLANTFATAVFAAEATSTSTSTPEVENATSTPEVENTTAEVVTSTTSTTSTPEVEEVAEAATAEQTDETTPEVEDATAAEATSTPEVEEATEATTAEQADETTPEVEDTTAAEATSTPEVEELEEAATPEEEAATIVEEITDETSNSSAAVLVNDLEPKHFRAATDIYAGDAKTVTISDDEEFVIFRFVPEEDGAYYFYAVDEEYAAFWMFDGDQEKINVAYTEKDDGSEGLKHLLTAGETYYYVALLTYSQRGSYTVYLEKESGFFCETVGETTRTVDLYSDLTLEVNATSDSPITYKWYIENYSGELLDDDLSVFTTQALYHGWYKCKVEDEDGNSEILQYYIYINNELEATPANEDIDNGVLYVNPGDSVELKVSVSATDPSGITAEWAEVVDMHAGDSIEGATELTYVIGPVYKQCEYVCWVYDRFENHAQASFTIKVQNHLTASFVEGYRLSTITVEPKETVDLSLDVSADDTSQLTYTWYRDGTELSDVTSASFITDPVTEYHYYSVVVSDQYDNKAYLYIAIIVDNNFKAYMDGGENEYATWNVLYFPLNDTPELKVAVSGYDTSGVTYYWTHDGEYVGNTNAVTTVPITGLEYYNCVVTDQYDTEITVYFKVYVDNLTAYPEGAEDGKDAVYIYATPGEPLVLKAITSTKYEGELYFQWSLAGNEIDGATTDTYTIDSVTQNQYYALYIKDDYDNSKYVHFYVFADNKLTAHPEGTESNSISVYAEPNESAVLKAVVSAKDESQLTHTWYDATSYPYQEITGATGSTYTTEAITEVKRYQYTVADQYGNSVTAYFSVYPKVNVTVLPEGSTESYKVITSSTGSSVNLKVNVTAKDTSLLTYQWYANGTALDGANTTELNISALGEGTVNYQFVCIDPYGYRTYAYFTVCGVKNTLGASTKVTLTNVASGMKIAWNAVSGAKYYKVYRGSTYLFTTSRTYGTDTGVKTKNGSKYTYKVIASTTKNDTSGDSSKYRTATGYRLIPVGIKTLKNSAAGKMTVTYDKNAKSSGYVVRYGLKSDMSNAKVITVSGANTTSRTFSNLTRGKTYYVQVRTYKLVNGVRYYSGYCTTKKIKITK